MFKLLGSKLGLLLVFGVELVIEFFQDLHSFFKLVIWSNQEGSPKMISSFSLFETASRHQDDPSVLQDFHAVEEVRLSIGNFNHFIRKCDRGKGIHRSFYFVGTNVLHGIQVLC